MSIKSILSSRQIYINTLKKKWTAPWLPSNVNLIQAKPIWYHGQRTHILNSYDLYLQSFDYKVKNTTKIT